MFIYLSIYIIMVPVISFASIPVVVSTSMATTASSWPIHLASPSVGILFTNRFAVVATGTAAKLVLSVAMTTTHRALSASSSLASAREQVRAESLIPIILWSLLIIMIFCLLLFIMLVLRSLLFPF